MIISNENNIPEDVKEILMSYYPTASQIEWFKNDHGNYEASFNSKGQHFEVHLNPKRQIIFNSGSEQEPNLPEQYFPFIRIDKSDDYEK